MQDRMLDTSEKRDEGAVGMGQCTGMLSVRT